MSKGYSSEPQFLIAYDAGVFYGKIGYKHIVVRQTGPQIREDIERLDMQEFLERIVRPMVAHLYSQFHDKK